jgi:PI-3-kinase-related kinase SMG-1
VIENNEGLLWFWGLWECSQFFVQSKLKTPLGKPQDSFLAIESALKAYFNNTSTNNETQSGSGESTIKSQKSNTDDWYMDLSRVTLLVQFVEYLEKNIYNAYEGTAGSMTQPSLKAIKIFFRTNKSTCIDWFSRKYSLSLFFPSKLNQE